MNNDILIIPDVHGRTFWKDAVSREAFGTVIFLGDYVDPYPRDGISNEQALGNFFEIIDYGKTQDNVVMLLGNHDMHYYSELFAKSGMSSRYWQDGSILLKEIFARNKSLFSLAYETTLNDHHYLFTHAGVNGAWLEANHEIVSVPDAQHLNQLLDSGEGTMALAQVSKMRGGFFNAGSIVWGDVREMLVSNGLPEVYQIFGHSQQRETPIINKKMACIDVRRPFVLRQGQPGIEPVEYA